MKGSPGYRFSKEELDWAAANLEQTVGWARNPPIVRWTLLATFLVGLAVYTVGFAVTTGAIALADGWPSALLGDLLASVGIALWTSVVIVFFLEVLPAWQSRQAARWSRAALAALQARGQALEVEVPGSGDGEIGAKLDAILTRLTTLEAALARPDGPSE
jgi:hypothetical protein